VGLPKGSFVWKNARRLQLILNVDKLIVRQAPLITAIESPILALGLSPFYKRLSLKGSVLIPRVFISIPAATAPVVNTSSDVRIVRQGQDPLAIIRAA
ncbi:hypothetical protein, partial [Acinetobacter baumannii]|uniref:hypothetical protein n=1 Tax=Acinetobacter baumannii TaxID=470 RepID=UPI001111E457